MSTVTVFPAMPPDVPASPQLDGIPHIRCTTDGVTLELRGGAKATIPNIAILKHSIKIERGGDRDVNKVTLTFLAAEVEVSDDWPAQEIFVLTPEQTIAQWSEDQQLCENDA